MTDRLELSPACTGCAGFSWVFVLLADDGFVTLSGWEESMALSNAEKCRLYRLRHRGVESVESVATPTDTRVDTVIVLLQRLVEKVSAIERHLSTLPFLNGPLDKEESTKEEINPPLNLPIPNLIRSLDTEFEEVWLLFLRKVGKGQARKAYRAARKKAPFDAIVAGIRKHALEHQTTELKFIPYPASWLNGQRWLDEEAKSNGHDAGETSVSDYSGPSRPLTEDEVRRILNPNHD
jgi:hypothetical protein